MKPTTIVVKRISISPELRNKILRRDKYACRYCGSKNPPFHLDHVYPVSKGGETSTENLVTACQKCNKEKLNLIGVFPKPIGYFELEKRDFSYKIFSPVALGCLLSILFYFIISEQSQILQILELAIYLICLSPLLIKLLKNAINHTIELWKELEK